MTEEKRRQVAGFFKKADPKIYPYVSAVDYKKWLGGGKANYFGNLSHEIIAQQLGAASARAIVERFRMLFPEQRPEPKKLSKIKPDVLKKKIGTSLSKANYLINLAKAVEEGELDLKSIDRLDDREVMARLTKIKGIGMWTAEMFLIFSLKREDIYSHGDYGLKRGIQKVYGLKQIPSEATIKRITNRWKPYRSYGSIALWHSLETGT